MNLLLDTHTFLWFFLDDPRLGEAQRRHLRDSENRLFLSAVSIFEMATKARIGKLPRSPEIDALLDTIYTDYDLAELNISAAHSRLAGRLDGPHRDPFDRLLAAQSVLERMPLVTNDPAFKSFGVETLW